MAPATWFGWTARTMRAISSRTCTTGTANSSGLTAARMQGSGGGMQWKAKACSVGQTDGCIPAATPAGKNTEPATFDSWTERCSTRATATACSWTGLNFSPARPAIGTRAALQHLPGISGGARCRSARIGWLACAAPCLTAPREQASPGPRVSRLGSRAPGGAGPGAGALAAIHRPTWEGIQRRLRALSHVVRFPPGRAPSRIAPEPLV
mmetsp:Transcript_16632/g.33766  ORF Transcript_16632/g.33766 Transcript_16632/m.33766 type:complete len:209 (-) Transcript_16632:22-648(-)